MSLPALDLSSLRAVVEPIVRAHGAEIADLQWSNERSGWVLRVLLERAGSAAGRWSTEQAAISLELCAQVARELSPALDVTELVSHRYNLEVGSPGIERALRTWEDFARFAGQLAKIKFKHNEHGVRVARGLLGPAPAEPGAPLSIEADGNPITFSVDDVATAQLVFEFGASKPAAKKKAAKAKNG